MKVHGIPSGILMNFNLFVSLLKVTFFSKFPPKKSWPYETKILVDKYPPRGIFNGAFPNLLKEEEGICDTSVMKSLIALGEVSI